MSQVAVQFVFQGQETITIDRVRENDVAKCSAIAQRLFLEPLAEDLQCAIRTGTCQKRAVLAESVECGLDILQTARMRSVEGLTHGRGRHKGFMAGMSLLVKVDHSAAARREHLFEDKMIRPIVLSLHKKESMSTMLVICNPVILILPAVELFEGFPHNGGEGCCNRSGIAYVEYQIFFSIRWENGIVVPPRPLPAGFHKVRERSADALQDAKTSLLLLAKRDIQLFFCQQSQQLADFRRKVSAQQVLQSIAVQISGQLAGAGIFDKGICHEGEICPAAGMEIDSFRSPQFLLQHGMDAGRQPAIA